MFSPQLYGNSFLFCFVCLFFCFLFFLVFHRIPLETIISVDNFLREYLLLMFHKFTRLYFFFFLWVWLELCVGFIFAVPNRRFAEMAPEKAIVSIIFITNMDSSVRENVRSQQMLKYYSHGISYHFSLIFFFFFFFSFFFFSAIKLSEESLFSPDTVIKLIMDLDINDFSFHLAFGRSWDKVKNLWTQNHTNIYAQRKKHLTRVIYTNKTRGNSMERKKIKRSF